MKIEVEPQDLKDWFEHINEFSCNGCHISTDKRQDKGKYTHPDCGECGIPIILNKINSYLEVKNEIPRA